MIQIKKIYSLAILLLAFNSYAQTKNNKTPLNNAVTNSTAFIDASSSVQWNKSTNIGKGLVFPRTDLTQLKSLAAPVNGLPASFPTRLDGMIVYNTATGTSGIGNIKVTPGFYYYKNSSKELNGGTWVRISDAQAAANLYTQNGTLTDNRTVNLDNKNLSFTGGQIGFNTTTPKATLDIQTNPNKTSVNDGILIPRVGTAKRNSFTDPENGLMVYNTDLNCYETNVGTPEKPSWQCLATRRNLQTVTIEPIGFKGNFKFATNNDPSQNKVLFKITNNTNATLNSLNLSYVYVDGATQYVDYGQNDQITLKPSESKVLEYGISGSNWSKISTFTLTFDKISSASIKLHIDNNDLNSDGTGKGNGGTADFQNMQETIFSVKDNLASAPINKSLTITNEKPLIVELPFINGKGNYLGYTSAPIKIKDIKNADRQIQLSYPEGNLDIGKGTIKATIISIDGKDLTLPQTQLGKSITIAQIPIKLNNIDKGNFNLIIFGGIADRRYGDGSGHNFIYMPVTSPSGRVWLNNNLGAEYARIESSVFDPQKQAQSLDDMNAFGSKFQYRRYADGHELTHIADGRYELNWNITNTLADNFRPNSKQVIINPGSAQSIPREKRVYNWVSKDYLNSHMSDFDNLWNGVDGANNPCPKGFRIPTIEEFLNEINYFDQKSSIGAYNSVLKFTTTNGFWINKGNRIFGTNPSNASITYNADQFTNSVRCIKN